MNFDFYVGDIENQLNFIKTCLDDMNMNGFSHVASRYNQITKSIPFNWYFCDGLFYEQIDAEALDSGYLSYHVMENNLRTLLNRLVSYKVQSTFQIDCSFDNIKQIIINEIIKTNISLNIAVAWLSDYDICNEIVKKSRNGISTTIIMHDVETNRNTSVSKESTIIKYYVPENIKGGIMHNKFCVFDAERVITGSYNWSKNANLHYENIVCILNSQIAQKFTQQFNKYQNQFSENRV